MTSSGIAVAPYCAADIENLLPIHLAAFKGYMNACMGKRYVKAFFNWFLTYPDAITLKAAVNGIVCGYVIGAPFGYSEIMNRDLLGTGIFSIVTHPRVVVHPNFVKAVLGRLSQLLRNERPNLVTADSKGKGIALIGIGVKPEYSGKGIGATLMKAFEDRARTMHMDYMRLSVYDDNQTARALYEKSMWKEVSHVGNTLTYQKLLR